MARHTLANGNSLDIEVTIPGNGERHFSVTAVERQRGREIAGGCLHAEVLEAEPTLMPVVALHLSDADGVPMHAEPNGWYWLAGACGGLGETYHGANNGTHDPISCRTVLGEHMRVGVSEVSDMVNTAQTISAQEGVKAARANFAQWVEDSKPRWKREAIEAIRVARDYLSK